VERCWRELIKIVSFDETVTSEKSQKGNADPAPHYDDARCVQGKMDGGYRFTLALLSGQSNYYGGLTIYDPNDGDVVYETDCTDPLEAFDIFSSNRSPPTSTSMLQDEQVPAGVQA